MTIILKNKKGITLVEVLVYIAIFSLSISALVSYFLMINVINIKNNTISMLENDSRYIFSLLENSIINSNEVIYPLLGMASSTLIIDGKEGDPDLKIYEENSALYIEEIGENIYNLSSDNLLISDLEFFVSGENGKNVKISFLLEVRIASSKEFEYSKKYYNSFTLR